jgi:hypothetical protein
VSEPIIVMERKGRPTGLYARHLRMIRGTRYATRGRIAAVIRGESGFVPWTNRRGGWSASATRTRLKVGCHVWTGEHYARIREWALSR